MSSSRRHAARCWLALLALCLHLLLPYAHAAARLGASGLPVLAVCSVAGNADLVAAPQDGREQTLVMLRCPLCVASAGQILAPPPAPAGLPACPEMAGLLQPAGAPGFFIPLPVAWLPPGRAPPALSC
ncbi:DUF2946 family protein [Chitinilyticum litopenaei]|uniref:DUF2946 family protein n=1 Tax=Chitinilyticum litopenaei TaxID=1121276 RepID=UPI00041C5F33|nr:DUF2946 family protein [Chitinilyticum litopenaei]